MIKTIRSFEIPADKDEDALDFAKRIITYMNKNYSLGKMEAWLSLSGSLRQLHFIGSYESMTAFEGQLTWQLRDKTFINFGKEIEENNLLLRQSDRREFFKVID